MIPGLATTPRVLLEKAIERVDKIENLVILEQDKEGFVHIWCTKMTLGDKAWITAEFNKRFDD